MHSSIKNKKDSSGKSSSSKTSPINKFSGKYAFLSNFYESPISIDGITYKTLEHAFQAAKTPSEVEQLGIAELDTPGQAKRAGRRVELRPDWDEIKVDVMYNLLCEKFAPGTELAKKLVDTAPCDLVEGNHWNDTFWGKCYRGGKWVGQNHLGQLLMLIREELRD